MEIKTEDLEIKNIPPGEGSFPFIFSTATKKKTVTKR